LAVDERKRQIKFAGDVSLERVFDFSVVEELNREPAK
jgi:hypothetical protein